MDSTQDLVSTVRARLLDFTPPSGDTLRTRLGGGTDARCYVGQAPPDVTYPYVVLRFVNRRQTPGDGGFRLRGDIEAGIFDRPSGNRWRAEAIADLMEQAWLHWADRTDGLTFAGHARRVPLPPAPDPMDRELVAITLFLPVTSWPDYLTTLDLQE